MENSGVKITILVVFALCLLAVVGGIVVGFSRGRVALGIILSIGVPAGLLSPLAVYTRYNAERGKDEEE
jgi:ABC-type sulfate transport system permease component